MKKIVPSFFIFFLFGFIRGYAQQDPVFNQYLFNKMLYNPAAAGVENDCFSVKGIYSRVISSYLPESEISPWFASGSAEGAFRLKQKYQLGLGFQHENIFYTFIGTKSYLGSVSFGVPMKIMDSGMFSVGISAGILDHSLYLVWKPEIEPDPNLPRNARFSNFDAGAGIYYHNPKFYAGLSLLHIPDSRLFRNESRYFGNDPYSIGSSVILTAGYSVRLKNRNMQLLPSFVIKKDIKRYSFATSCIFLYKQRYWGGLTFKDENIRAVSLMTGLKINTKIGDARIGYSYDIASQFPTLWGGMHELTISLNVKVKKGRV